MARSGNARDQAGAASLAVALRPWNAAPMWFATARHRSPYVLRHPPLAAFASSQGPGKGGGQGRYCPQPGGAGKNDPERLRQVACSGEPAPVRMLGCARTPHDHRFVPRSGPPDQAGWVRPAPAPPRAPLRVAVRLTANWDLVDERPPLGGDHDIGGFDWPVRGGVGTGDGQPWRPRTVTCRATTSPPAARRRYGPKSPGPSTPAMAEPGPVEPTMARRARQAQAFEGAGAPGKIGRPGGGQVEDYAECGVLAGLHRGRRCLTWWGPWGTATGSPGHRRRSGRRSWREVCSRGWRVRRLARPCLSAGGSGRRS